MVSGLRPPAKSPIHTTLHSSKPQSGIITQMNLVYYAHSYRKPDTPVVEFFSDLMRSERLIASLDPPSDRLNSAKPERHLKAADGMVAVLTARESGISPYILYEISLCLRANKPLLVFVEDVLPSGLISSRILQRRFSRKALLRQVRDHRYAVQMLRSYIGDDPPPAYQPTTEMRQCLLGGLRDFSPDITRTLEGLLAERGYATHVLLGEVVDCLYNPNLQDTLNNADLAVAFIESNQQRAEFFLGALRAAFVPTILLTADPAFSFHPTVPREYQARIVDASAGESVRSTVNAEISIVEEEYVDLENQEQVGRYADLLLNQTSGPGYYTESTRNIFIQELNMGDQNINHGQAGSIGRQSQGVIHNYDRVWAEMKPTTDLAVLAAELEQLRQTLRQKAQTVDEDKAVASVGEAASEARNGNGPAVLQKLASAGAWVLGVAKEIGVKIATEALSKSLNLGT